MKEQIEEMACAICGNNKICLGQGVKKCLLHPQMRRYAENAYKEGYRKQKEGEWVWIENGESDCEKYWVCSVCKEHDFVKSKFCPNCGAQMKGANNEN